MYAVWPVVLILACVVVGMLTARFAALERRLAGLSRMDAKLDALMKHFGIKFDPSEQAPVRVIEALNRGEKIQAIRFYREATGVGLKEAKEYVEELQRRAGMTP